MTEQYNSIYNENFYTTGNHKLDYALGGGIHKRANFLVYGNDDNLTDEFISKLMRKFIKNYPSKKILVINCEPNNTTNFKKCNHIQIDDGIEAGSIRVICLRNGMKLLKVNWNNIIEDHYALIIILNYNNGTNKATNSKKLVGFNIRLSSYYKNKINDVITNNIQSKNIPVIYAVKNYKTNIYPSSDAYLNLFNSQPCGNSLHFMNKIFLYSYKNRVTIKCKNDYVSLPIIRDEIWFL